MIRSKQKNSNNVLFRLGIKAFIIILVIGIPVLLFMFTFNIENVEVAGANQYTEEQIKGFVFQTKPDNYSLYLYLKNHFFEKQKIPFIEKLEIEMEDSHSITIYVYEKMIAGSVEFMGEYLYFDKDGIVVESTREKIDKVPVYKGLKFKEIILHEKLKVQKDELFDVIINLTQLIHKYELDVDSVTFNSNNEVTIDSADITVSLGKKSTYDVPLAELKNILKEAEGRSLAIDMRDYTRETHKIIAKPKKSTE